MNKKLLIVQSGEMSALSNTVIASLVLSAKDLGNYSAVYGAVGGLYGIIDENLLDLTNTTNDELKIIKNTPACVLGTAGGNITYDFGEYEYTRIIEVLKVHSISHLAVLGDKSAAVLSEKISARANELSFNLSIAFIPVSAYNEVSTKSFNIGYRTAAKLVATCVASAYLDVMSHTNDRSVMLFETPEKYSGWLSLAASLANVNGKKCPALTFIPEYPFNLSDFVLCSDPILRNERNVALSVYSKGVTNPDGSPYFPSADLSQNMYGNLYKHELSSFIAFTARENLVQIVYVFESTAFLRTSPYVIDSNDIKIAEISAEAAIRNFANSTDAFVVDATDGNAEISDLSSVSKEYNRVPDEYYTGENYSVTDDCLNAIHAAFGSDVPTNFSYTYTAPTFNSVDRLLPEAKIRFR